MIRHLLFQNNNYYIKRNLNLFKIKNILKINFTTTNNLLNNEINNNNNNKIKNKQDENEDILNYSKILTDLKKLRTEQRYIKKKEILYINKSPNLKKYDKNLIKKIKDKITILNSNKDKNESTGKSRMKYFNLNNFKEIRKYYYHFETMKLLKPLIKLNEKKYHNIEKFPLNIRNIVFYSTLFEILWEAEKYRDLVKLFKNHYILDFPYDNEENENDINEIDNENKLDNKSQHNPHRREITMEHIHALLLSSLQNLIFEYTKKKFDKNIRAKYIKMFNENYKLFRERFNLPKSNFTLNIILESLINQGRIKSAEYLFRDIEKDEEMINNNLTNDELIKKNNNIQLNRLNYYTYTTILSGLAQNNYLNQAVEIFEHMKERNIEPTITHYNSLLQGFFKEDKYDAAKQFFNIMKKKEEFDLKKNIKNSEKFKISQVTYTIIIDSHLKLGKVDEALYYFNEMKEKNIKLTNVTYSALLQGLIKNHEWNEAENILNKWIDDKLPIYINNWNDIIFSYIKENEINKAINIINIMEENNIKPNKWTFMNLFPTKTPYLEEDNNEYLMNLENIYEKFIDYDELYQIKELNELPDKIKYDDNINLDNKIILDLRKIPLKVARIGLSYYIKNNYNTNDDLLIIADSKTGKNNFYFKFAKYNISNDYNPNLFIKNEINPSIIIIDNKSLNDYKNHWVNK